jgi:hypothetical protein
MNFLLAGFKERAGAREFSFDCVSADRSRTQVIVDADMALARKQASCENKRVAEAKEDRGNPHRPGSHCVRGLEAIRLALRRGGGV